MKLITKKQCSRSLEGSRYYLEIPFEAIECTLKFRYGAEDIMNENLIKQEVLRSAKVFFIEYFLDKELTKEYIENTVVHLKMKVGHEVLYIKFNKEDFIDVLLKSLAKEKRLNSVKHT